MKYVGKCYGKIKKERERNMDYLTLKFVLTLLLENYTSRDKERKNKNRVETNITTAYNKKIF